MVKSNINEQEGNLVSIETYLPSVGWKPCVSIGSLWPQDIADPASYYQAVPYCGRYGLVGILLSFLSITQRPKEKGIPWVKIIYLSESLKILPSFEVAW